MKLNISKLGRIIATGFKKNKACICLGAGIATGMAAVGTAIWATSKVPEVKGKHEEKIKEIEAKYPEVTEENKAAYKKEMSAERAKNILRYAKLYSIPTVLEAASVFFQFTDHKILKNNWIGATGVAAALAEELKQYRANVVEKFGEDVDKELSSGKLDEVEEIDENGLAQKIKKAAKAEETDGGEFGPFAILFSKETTPYWTSNAVDNRFFILGKIYQLQDELKRNGFLFLGDVAKALGIAPKNKKQAYIFQNYGWTYYNPRRPQADADIDPGLSNRVSTKGFVEGYEPSVWLKFNCQPEPITSIIA